MKTVKFFSRKHALVLVLVCWIALPLEAQNSGQKDSSTFWHNVRFGGGLGLSFGDGFFSGSLAPSAIYEFNEFLAAGIGLNGTYSKRTDIHKSTILGGSILALFNPIYEIQLSTEFEQLHVSRNFDETFISNVDDKYWYSGLFLGAGYRSGHFTIGIRYDVLYDEEKSIYADPWIPFVRVFF
jgi:hypothetical protein